MSESAFGIEHGGISKMIRVGAAGNSQLKNVAHFTQGTNKVGGAAAKPPNAAQGAARMRRATAQTQRARFGGANAKQAGGPAALGAAMKANKGGARKAAPTGMRANLKPMASQYKKELGAAGGVAALGGAGAYGMNRKQR